MAGAVVEGACLGVRVVLGVVGLEVAHGRVATTWDRVVPTATLAQGLAGTHEHPLLSPGPLELFCRIFSSEMIKISTPISESWAPELKMKGFLFFQLKCCLPDAWAGHVCLVRRSSDGTRFGEVSDIIEPMIDRF